MRVKVPDKPRLGAAFRERKGRGMEQPETSDVIVVGGGNTAVDCARSALRFNTCEVKILYRRTRREMPCLMQEVEAAEAEGVDLEFLVLPIRLERGGQHQLLLTCQRMEFSEPDASGRRRPVSTAP